MTDHICECPLRGFCYKHMLDKGQREHDICRGVNVEEHVRRKYLEAWGSPPPVFVPPKVGVARDGLVVPVQSGTVGTELKKLIGWFGIKPCGSCGNYANEMDRNGIEWCEANVETIIKWMSEGAAKIGLAGFTLDRVPGFEFGARKLVEQAISKAKSNVVINPNRRIPRPTDPPIKIPSRWTAEPTRHMIYHIWPTKRSECWRWNVEQLRRRIELFNGVRVVGIAVDSDTVTADEVKAAFAGVRIDHWVIVSNDRKIGEGATFHKMMELLPRGVNDITWYGHAKGTKYESTVVAIPVPGAVGSSGLVPRWTELLYRSTLDHYSEVRKSLESFPITGSMKRYGDFNKPETWRWHYSGTFFWFRNADTFARPQWRKLISFYGAVECWPSCVFKAAEGGVLLGNDVGLLYVESEVVKHEEAYKSWPTDERPTSNGVTDRQFYDEETRREADHWPELVALHGGGVNAIKSLGAKTVVEIGSGLGPFLVAAQSAGLDAIGLGCSPFERDYAISRGVPPERYLLDDATTAMLPQVDAIYCIEVLEHIPEPQLGPMLDQIAAKCRWFYFSSTPHPADDDATWGHVTIKTKAEWIELFSRHGLRFVRDDKSVVEWGMIFISGV